MINLGNKKFKTLHKGDKLISRVYKGDELIYRDIEALYGMKLTIDTRYKEYKEHSASATKKMTFSDLRPVTIDWGDGVREDFGDVSYPNRSVTATHTYAEHGIYQISIIPRMFTATGEPIAGWANSMYYGTDGSVHKVISFDKPIPPFAYRLAFGYASGQTDWRRTTAPSILSVCTHLESAPENFFDAVAFEPGKNSSNSIAGLFIRTFSGTGAFTSFSPFPLAKKFLKQIVDSLDLSSTTNFSSVFAYTFEGYFKVVDIPADLFPAMDTSHGTNFDAMFKQTFRVGRSYAYGSPHYLNIPEGLFDFLDTSNGTTFQEMFSLAFAHASMMDDNSQVLYIPADLFSHVDTRKATNTSRMFSQTFDGYRHRAKSGNLPAGLFDTIKTPNVTNVTYMFESTFSDCANDDNDFSVPEEFFKYIDTSNCTSVEGLFRRTFYAQGPSKPSPLEKNRVPDDIFSYLNTSNVVNFSSAFDESLRQYGFATSGIPENFLANIDTSSGVNFSSMFKGTFRYSDSPVPIPANLFSHLDTRNGQNFSGMFANTFHYSRSTAADKQTQKIPNGLFSHLDTSNGTSFSSMFNGTFSYFSYDERPIIPADLFDFLDMSKATSTASMFNQTFLQFALPSNLTSDQPTYTIPAGLFSKVVAKGNASEMFYNTFASLCSGYVHIEIPQTLFATINMSGVTSAASMFRGVFQNDIPTEIPQGIFGGIDLTGITNVDYVFGYTFGLTSGMWQNGKRYTIDTVVNDPFDGMSYFGWADATTANKRLPYFYGIEDYLAIYSTDASVGSASTILQHFNFTPNTDTNMFKNRVGLTDYNTINDNWK